MLINLLNILLVLSCLVLIFLVLIQRGKGGGLAGAFGGAGGSSAFGSKAGDIFTKITMYVAGVWIALSMLLVLLTNRGSVSAFGPDAAPGGSAKAPLTPGPKGTGSKATDQPAGSSSKKMPEIDEAAPGQAPSKPSTPAQPINPGDPTPILPIPVPKNQ